MTKNLLRLKLLGSPSVFLNQEEVFFPFAKINALLYYLHINGAVNREEIAGILWENKDNQTAKKNLRNTIYQANKLLGGEWIVAPNRTVLSLNPECAIESDVELFMNHPAEHLSLYQGDFLKGFYLKDSEGLITGCPRCGRDMSSFISKPATNSWKRKKTSWIWKRLSGICAA